MARLNEALVAPVAPGGVGGENIEQQGGEMRTKSKKFEEKPPADLEEVKRAFVRQNRELAKRNSEKSTRISFLELDNRRLLDENIQLRERNLRLQRLCENARARASAEAIHKIRDELQAKFSELSRFVVGLADVHEDGCVDQESKPRDKILSPSERNYKDRQPLAELMRGSQMPTIVEDKQYPRRTLDVEDIHKIRLSDQDSNESPDLGPPPVARLDWEAVSKSSPPPKPTPQGEPSSPNEDKDEAFASNFLVNLETRRKRREGQSKLEIRRRSILEGPPADGDGQSTGTIMRTGAKRKMSDRDTDKPGKSLSKDDFAFSRRLVLDRAEPVEQQVSSTNAATSGPEPGRRDVEAHPPSSPRATRKILGEKNANVSPRKEPIKAEMPEKHSKDRLPAPRAKRVPAVTIPHPADELLSPTAPLPPETTSIELPPETPAATDLLSPGLSADPWSHNQPMGHNSGAGGAVDTNRDTPPPTDLRSTSNTTDAGTQRPSRRSRSAAVNYAEPSLVAKMRRPDKTLADAVSGLQDPRRVMNAPLSAEQRRGLPPSSSSSSIKEADGVVRLSASEDVLRPRPHSAEPELGASPLNQKSSEASAKAAAARPTEPILRSERPPARAASASDIPALLAATGRKRRESSSRLPSSRTSTADELDAAARKMEELDLYEFKDSSSPQMERSQPQQMGTTRMVAHRRHSSVPKDIAAGGVGGGTERIVSRRKSTML